MGGIFSFFGGQVQLAKMLWTSGQFWFARGRRPQGPAPRQWAVELLPNTQRGPLLFYSLL